MTDMYLSVSERKDPQHCPQCNGIMDRLIGVPEMMVAGLGERDSRGERIWFPKDGQPYFDRSLQRTFSSAKEKKEYMRENNLIMDGSHTKIKTESGDLRSREKRKQLKMED